MLPKLKDVIDDRLCYERLRELRWSEGVKCPYCNSMSHRRQGQHAKCEYLHCYQCKACQRYYDDLTNTIFQDLHPPLKTWVLCLGLMELGIEENKVARELGVSENDCRAMQKYLRERKGDNLFAFGQTGMLSSMSLLRQKGMGS